MNIIRKYKLKSVDILYLFKFDWPISVIIAIDTFIW